MNQGRRGCLVHVFAPKGDLPLRRWVPGVIFVQRNTTGMRGRKRTTDNLAVNIHDII